MRSKRWLLGLVLLLGAAGPVKDDANNDADGLQGSWTMVLVFINGEELPAEQVRSGQLVIDDNQYRAQLGANTSTSTIKVDSSKTPKQIDFTFTDGDQKGKTVKGIYKLGSDGLTICRGLTEMETRPTEFAAPVDSGLLLVVWKRSKTAVNDKAKAIDEELKRFTATWRFVSIEAEGNQIPDEVFRKDTLVLKGKQFASYVAGKMVHGVVKIDPTVTPKTIDITFTEGPGKGHTQRGIYELDGDTQKICTALAEQPRPTEFVSKPGSGLTVQILKREQR
jgi:uncharacterized protein (TIGR03067 family)